jgi:hypothetical protein
MGCQEPVLSSCCLPCHADPMLLWQASRDKTPRCLTLVGLSMSRPLHAEVALLFICSIPSISLGQASGTYRLLSYRPLAGAYSRR